MAEDKRIVILISNCEPRTNCNVCFMKKKKQQQQKKKQQQQQQKKETTQLAEVLINGINHTCC